MIEKIRFISFWNFLIMKPNLKDIAGSSLRRQILKTAFTFVTGLTATSLVSLFDDQIHEASTSNRCATTK